MSKTQYSGHRETRKPQRELPAVPDLGHLSMPRKGNRTAAKRVASGDVLWDKRRVTRKARKRALETQAARTALPAAHRLSRRQKQWLLAHLPGWSLGGSADALQAPEQITREQLDELVEATRLPYVQRAVLKVQGLSAEQVSYVAERAPKTVRFVLVDPLGLNQRVIRVPRLA